MQIYSENSEYKLYQGNMLDMGELIQDGTVDSIVTDPPYELNFMGKGWDNSGIAFQPDTWKRCLEALKPGGYLLAFGGSRTYHRIACAIEDAGFEIRDCIMWLYGSGFPKSMALDKSIEGKLTTGSANKTEFHKLNGELNDKHHYGFTTANKEQGIRPKDYTTEGESNQYLKELQATTELAKQYKGWGTCLKPSYEPIIVARKPLEGSCTDNVIKYGVGGINIDECRVEYIGDKPTASGLGRNKENHTSWGWEQEEKREANGTGRFPANTILTYDESDFEEVCGGFPDTKSRFEERNDKHDFKGNKEAFTYGYKKRIGSGFNDEGSAARYFYCAKASKRDRDEGLDGFETKKTGELQGGRKEGSAGSIMQNADGGTRVNPYAGTGTPKKNIHPTVKPCDLMQYLVRLVTPNGGTVLDPFNGSGSTGKAVMYENKDRNKNYKYIGIELTEEYLPIAKARIEYVINKGEEKSEPKQEDQNKERKESALF